MRDARKGVINRRGLLAMGAAATVSMTAAAVAAPNVPADADVSFVHPELRAFAQMYLKYASGYTISAETLAQTRKASSGFQKPFDAAVSVEEKRIPASGNAPDVLVYVINAKPGSARPGILHVHGGGFVLGSARDSVPDLQQLAIQLDCTVVTVDYRLAPDAQYTDILEDVYAGLRWTHRHAAQLGVDPARIAVMGESAGGGLAALLAIMARDRAEIPVIFQCLLYPMLDDRTGSTRQPSNSNMGRIIWTQASNRFGWASFLGQPPGTDAVPAAAVPARVVNLAGLPPAFIGVGAIDLFVDEDVDYARRLVDAGVQTELIVVPGAFHGFDGVGAKGSFFSIPGGPPPIAVNFTAAKIDALKRAFAGTF
jgi:acetyl esterase/lipase